MPPQGTQKVKRMEEFNEKEALKLENQLCFPLYAAARQVVSLYTPYLRTLGITYPQYIVFLVLWERDGIPVGELGRRLYLDNGTLTPLLKKLESAGYLTRSRAAEDERIVTVSLTESGRALREQAREIPLKVGSCIGLEEKDAVMLYDLLYKLLREEK